MAYRIYLIYHSHIDIGYTERQELISSHQADFISQAVACVLSQAQAHRSGRDRFRFTSDGFWAIEQYLEKYGEAGRQRLLKAIQTGDFELNACYFHLADILNLANLNRSLDYAQDFSKENGWGPVKVAMASDINGFSWGFSDCLYEHGVRYLATNINSHHGGPAFGKALVPFYWKTPKGSRLLVWNGLTYHKANLLGLIPGLAVVGDPGIPGMTRGEMKSIKITGIDDYAASQLFDMVKGLKREGYPYDFLPIMGSGLYTDNSPAGDAHCGLIRQWNERYGDQIEIVTATLGEFFAHLERQADIPEYAGEWTDWWTDGVMSTPQPLRLFRNAQRTQSLIERLAGNGASVSSAQLDAITRNLLHYAEHTWGHSASYYSPCNLLVQQLEYRKAKYAVDADIAASSLLDQVVRQLGGGEFTTKRPFEYIVINPLDRPVKMAAYLPIDDWEAGLFADGVQVLDGELSLPAQTTRTLRGLFAVVVVSLLPRERKQLSVRPGLSHAENRVGEAEGIFENDFYRLRYSRADGIVSWVNKLAQSEMLADGAFRLGQPLYQVFPGGNRSDAAGFGYGSRKIPEQKTYAGELLEMKLVEHGPVFAVLEATYQLPSVLRCRVQYQMYYDLPQIEMRAEVIKNLVLDPEGLYVALPFQMQNAQWHLDKPGSFERPSTQLPGTCSDYFPLHRGLALAGSQGGVAINTLDAPLMMIGGLKLWHYSTKAEDTGTAYSWLMNNKWETNFKAECSGCHESRYVLEPFGPTGNDEDILFLLDKNDMGILALRK